MNSHHSHSLAPSKTADDSSRQAETSPALGQMPDQVTSQAVSHPAGLARRSAASRRTLRGKRILQDLRYIGLMFIVTRLVLVLVGLVAQSVFSLNPIGKSAALSPFPWLDMWGVWDSYWYMDIVQNGYSTVGRLPELDRKSVV